MTDCVNTEKPLGREQPRGTSLVTYPRIITGVLAGLSIPLVLHYHLLPTVFAGLTVHVLTLKLAQPLPERWGGLSRKFALGVLVGAVIGGLFALGFAFWAFLHGGRGMAALLTTIAETLENVRRSLPLELANLVPDTMEDLRDQAATVLRDHSRQLSQAGMAGLKTFLHIAFGMVIGGMTALHHFRPTDHGTPFAEALHERASRLADAFEKVVFAQVKISALNTMFTVLYLLLVLPLFHVRLPLASVLIPLTFIAGLIPVIGNLISNTAIVLIGLGVSPAVALVSLGFLVGIHKLEYFFNARIVGGEVQAEAWELLCAMVVMEAVFGMPGLISAPVVYAWLKDELKACGVLEGRDGFPGARPADAHEAPAN